MLGSCEVAHIAGPPAPQPPRKRGRPKGYPKTGGRQKGTKNWTNVEIRGALLSKSNAIEVLADIVAGRPVLCGTERTSSQTGAGNPVWRYPTLNQRLKGLEILLAKVIPDLKSVEQVVDAPVCEASEPPLDPRQAARAVLMVLHDASQSTEASATLDRLNPDRR